MSWISEIYKTLPCYYAKDSDTNIYRFLNSFADSLETFSSNLNLMRSQLYVDTASGDSLDKLGAVFNLPRMPGESDNLYRARIKSYIPGFLGGGTFDAIVTNVKNRWGWDVLVKEYPSSPYIPKIKVRIILNENYPGNYPTIGFDEFHRYIGEIKAAGVGYDTAFITSGEEKIELAELSAPVFTESALYECFYDCPSTQCIYDGNCLYAVGAPVYSGGYDYNEGWTYGLGPSGLSIWDLTLWDDNDWN